MTSWRDLLDIHPAALALPPLSDEEKAKLQASIKAIGLQQPPVFRVVDGAVKPELIDGIHRLDACEALGFEIKLVVGDHTRMSITGPDWSSDRIEVACDDPAALVDALNLARRQMTKDAVKRAAAALLKLQPERSDRSIAAEVKLSPSTVANVRREVELSSLDTSTKPEPEPKSEPEFVTMIRGDRAAGGKDGSLKALSRKYGVPMAKISEICREEKPAKTGPGPGAVVVSFPPPPLKTRAPRTGRDGKVRSLPAVPSSRPKSVPRDKAVTGMSAYLSTMGGASLGEGLEDLVRLLKDQSKKLQALPEAKRVNIVRGMMQCFGVSLEALEPVGAKPVYKETQIAPGVKDPFDDMEDGSGIDQFLPGGI